MPAGTTDVHQTRPLESCRAPPPRASGSSQPITTPPSIGIPTPCGNRPCSSTAPIRYARACRPQHQCASRGAGPHTNHRHRPDMPKVTTCPAHTARPPTMPMPGRRQRPIPSHRRRPGQPSAGPAKHKLKVDPHRPFNHIETVSSRRANRAPHRQGQCCASVEAMARRIVLGSSKSHQGVGRSVRAALRGGWSSLRDLHVVVGAAGAAGIRV